MKVGCDLVRIGRFESLNDDFLYKYFSKNEIEYINKKSYHRGEHIAGLFAAKEATLKALGCGAGAGVSISDVEIEHDEFGAPHIKFTDKTGKYPNVKLHVSISHSNVDAMAVVILE